MERTFNKPNKNIMIKFTAVFTVLCFLFTGVFADISQAAVISGNEKQSMENSRAFLTLPSIGLVTKAVDFGSSEVIINIQDLHSHPQTQRNIAKIISYLDGKYKLSELFLEGAYGTVDTKWLSRMEENELGRQMIEDLVESGQLGGVEYYSAINNKDGIIKGIEDKSIYEENIKLLNEIIDLQPEINEICARMQNEMEPVRKAYFNRDTDRLNKLVKRYKSNKISANKYYEKLSELAEKRGVNLNEFENVKAYMNLLAQSKNLNLDKVSKQFKTFVNVLKSNIEYGKYSELAQTSNNFQDIENIVSELKDIADKNKIFENGKFAQLKDFFTYLEFNKNVNLIVFVEEEKQLLNRLYAQLSKNKYEREVTFLYEFIPVIKEYFGANITADDYLRFSEDFKKFRIIWNSYFPDNTSRQLDKYERLLAKYHSNNIERNRIFADKILPYENNDANINAAYGQEAIVKLRDEINGKKIKVIVTGGFHSRGLEQIAKERKISYIQITPKITKDISRAGEIHWNTIRGYRQVLDNTINAKPLTETWTSVLFPEILARALAAANELPDFLKLNPEKQKQLIREVVDQALKSRNYNDKVSVDWRIEEFEKDKAKITAVYTDASETEIKTYNEEYNFDGKSLLPRFHNIEKKEIRKTSPNEESVQSIFNNIFKNTKTFWYRLYTTVIAPVWEEFVFRFIPFAITGSLAAILPVPLAAFAVAAVAGLAAFPFAHVIADKLFLKSGSKTRNFKDFILPSLVFTAVYVTASALFPAVPLAGFAASFLAHAVYNSAILISRNFINLRKIPAAVLKTAKLEISSVFDKLFIPREINVNEKIGNLINKLDSMIRNDDYAMRNYGPKMEGSELSMTEQIKKMRADLSNAYELSDAEKYDLYSKKMNYLYEIMVACAEKGNGEEFGGPMLLAKSVMNMFYMDSLYIRDGSGNLLFDKIIDYALIQKKMFIASDSIRLLNLIDSLYEEHPERAAFVLREAYKAGFFRKDLPLLRSLTGFELAKFFYTAVSQDGMGIIITEKDEPVLPENETAYFIKNGEASYFNFSLNDVISRLQYIQTTSFYKQNENINGLIEKVTAVLKNASKLPPEEKYKIISEQFNYLVSELIKHGADVNIFNDLIPVLLFVKNAYKDESLALTVFNYVFEIRLADKKESYSSLTTISKTDFLLKISSRIFLINRELGLSLLKQMQEKRLIDIKLFSDEMRRDKAYSKIPYGWSDVIKTYAELELFYDAVGIPYEEVNETISIYDRVFYKSDYLRMLKNMLPDAVTGKIKSFSAPATYFRTKKHEIQAPVRDVQSENKFEIFNYILENNILALSELNRGNEDSLLDSILFLQRMIDGLKKFDTQYSKYGEYSQKALDKIKRGLASENVTAQNKLKFWTADKIEEIDTVHTLINAVHQTSISVFMNIIDDEIKKDSAKEVIVNPSTNYLKVYDFSKKEMRPEVKDFLAKIAESKQSGILYISDGRLLYNRKLGAHSVSIFVDFDNTEDSIVCTFYDSGRSDGNAMRTTMLSLSFAAAGFDITSFDNRVAGYFESIPGLCEFKAVWASGSSESLRKGELYAEYFKRAFSIVENTKDLDFRLQGLEYDNDKNFYHQFAIPQLTLEDFRVLKTSRRIPESVIRDYEKQKETMDTGLQLDDSYYEEYKAEEDIFGAVYDYLGLKGPDRNIENVERMYVEGRIIKNLQTGFLEINPKYRPMSKIVDIINGNEWARDESFKQAQLLNLLDYSKINFRTEGYIGGMIAKSGVIKLSEGWLSVKAVVDAERERMQCAFVEYVDVYGNRTELNYDELLQILQESGYEVERQSERSSSEKKKTINTLHEHNPFMKETPTAKAIGLSVGTGGSVIGKVEYDENNLKQDSIWIAQQIMKESVEKMDIPAGFCITSGGIYSHASIVAREKNKPAVLLQSKWVDNEIELRYYTYKGGVVNEGGFFIRETVEHTVRIKAGDVVLINPETGEMLLFNEINKSRLDALQKMIDASDAQGVKNYLKANESDPDIGKLVEYVYYQSAGTQKLKEILRMLVAWEYDDKIGEKIDELNIVYVLNKVKEIQNIFDNAGNTEDIKEAYVLIKSAEKQINSIVLRKADPAVKELKVKIAGKKREILAEYVRYIEGFKNTADKLLKKSGLSGRDMDIAVKLVEMAKYWKYFYGYKGIKELTDALDEKIRNNFSAVYEASELDAEIKSFDEIGAADKLKFGSKTTELAKINNSGRNFGILAGLGISSGVLDIFFKDVGRFDEFKTLMSELSGIIKTKDMSKFERAAEIAGIISQMIKDSDSPKLKKYIDNLGKLKYGKRYAVRSSGIGEDGANYSFAGMAKTKLNRDKENIYADIKEVWESFFEPETVKYMLKSGQFVKPAVLVQEFVENIKSAGVIFSSDANGDFNMEIVRGVGEGLASGKIDPDRIKVFHRDGRIEYRRALQNKKKIIALPYGGIQIEKLENKEKINRITDESNIRKMVDIVYALRQEVGYPVDVEFAIDSKDDIFILQRRPDTAFNGKINESEAKRELEEAVLTVQSVADSFLRKIKIKSEKLYKNITVFAVPAIEELIFRFIPFFALGIIAANPLSAVPIAITAAVSVFAFSYAHTLADKITAKKSPQTQIRDWKSFVVPSVLFTGFYVLVYVCLSSIFPFFWINFAALIVATAAHAVYNKFALEGKIKKPVAEILKDGEQERTRAVEKIKRLKKDIFENNSKTICFVCSGNTDRSPVAEMLFKSLMRKSGKTNIKAMSAGTYADSSYLGMPLKPEYVAELEKYGVPDDIIKSFGSSNLTPEHLKSDYFIAAGKRHKAALIKMGVPEEKIITFAELAPSLVSDELPDPYAGYELKIKVTALINRIFEDNFASDSLLKEPEDFPDFDTAMILDLINYLKNMKVYRFQNDISEIIDILSKITPETPAEQKNSIIFDQLIKLQAMFGSPKDSYFLHIVPLATVVKNPQTGRLLLYEFADMLKAEKEKISASAPLYSDMWANNQYSNLRSAAINIFEVAYSTDKKNALGITKILYELDFIDNNEIPWGLRDIIKEYNDLRDYYLSFAKPGVDQDMLKGLLKTIEMLQDIKLQDEELNIEKESAIRNLNSLVDVINPSTARIADYHMQKLIAAAVQLLKSGRTEEASEIIKAILPVCEQMASKTKILNEKTLRDLSSVAEQFFSMSMKDPFDAIVSYLLFVAKSSDDARTNEKACEHICKITSLMYNSAKKAGANSEEYKKTETEILAIFEKFAENTPENLAVYRYLFDNLGFKTQTLALFIKALNNSRKAAVPYLPDDEKIINSKEIIELLLKSTDTVIIERLCLRLYMSGTNGKKTALALIDKLFTTAEDPNAGIELRKKAAVSLGRTASLLYQEFNDDKVLNIARINKIYADLNIEALLQESTVYFENIYGRTGYGESYAENFDFTPLISRLPKSLIAKGKLRAKSPVFMENRGRVNKKNKEVAAMTEDFDSLQDILKYNVIVLERMKKLNDRSSRKDFDKTVEIVARMIQILKKINPEHGAAAEAALEKILSLIPNGDIEPGTIKKQVALSKWNEDSIASIEEIHTLINAIHQTSILDFKQKVKSISGMDKGDIRTSRFIRDNTSILAYDLSDSGKMNRDIQSFLTRLASDRVSIDDFVFRDDILVWTTRLFAHSVDIFINFGEKDRGISIYYNENGRKSGYAERVRYFSQVLTRLGFDVVSDTEEDFSDKKPGTCGLKAVLNKDFGLNEETDIAEIAARAVLLYKHSTNLDMELEELADRYSEGSYLETLAKLVDKFMAGEIWYGYSYVSNGRTAFRDNTMTERFPKPSFSAAKQIFDEVFEYLGIEKAYDGSRRYYELDQSFIDKYFNKPLEQAYDEGRIAFDENGYLVKNVNYDIIEQLVNAILEDEYDALKQSRIINLISRSKFSFKTIGFIGNLMFVTGNVKLSNGETLSVRGLMNPYTRRLKYAQTEIISAAGREKLTEGKLTAVLNGEGYKISPKQELIGTKERERIKSFLSAQIQNTDSSEVLCTGTSDGKGTYVAGNITFDRKNAGSGDILLVKFTVPDDVKAIESVKAVITTGGGTLSHAAITTRELKKPSVVLNGASWNDGSVEVTYYTYEEAAEEIKGFNVRKVKENTVMLKEGTKVLVNGETGRILLFNDIAPRLLDQLQRYIEAKDIKAIKTFFGENKDNENIRKLVEYIYFQTIGDKELEEIMFVLFDSSLPEAVRQKVKELNVVYVKNKVRNISESLKNLENIDNINISYGIITGLNDKLNYIKTIENREDINALKKDIASAQEKIKDGLLEYVTGIIETGKTLASKKKLNASDIENIVKLLHQISVYRYFIPESEKREDLAEKRNEIKNLVLVLENIVTEYQSKKKISIDSEICGFSEISAGDAYRFGSKTTELALIYRLLSKIKGVKVPAGVGISANVLYMFFSETGQNEEYRQLTADFELAVKTKNETAAKQIAKKIQKLIDGSKDKKQTFMQKVIEGKMKSSLRQGARYSVRSSGVGEDSENKAFAGMGETKLNVSYGDVFENIRECWKSFYSDRCIEYMIKTGQIVKPAVLIQEMINVDKAGVIFSRNKYGNTIIEGVYGLGEGTVSGIITPDTVEVETTSGEIIEYSVADKYSKIVAAANGTSQEVVTEGAKDRVLSAEAVKTLMDIVNVLEKDAGYPVDIEYGIKDDEIYILQRRPITTLEDAAQTKPDITPALEEKEAKQMAAVSFEDMPAGSEILFNMANPLGQDEAIHVYLKKTDGNVSVFCIDSKYEGKIDSAVILSMIVDRINTDSVVRDKFNGYLSVIAKIGEMEMGILPFPYIDTEESIIPAGGNIDIKHIKTMLMSA